MPLSPFAAKSPTLSPFRRGKGARGLGLLLLVLTACAQPVLPPTPTILATAVPLTSIPSATAVPTAVLTLTPAPPTDVPTPTTIPDTPTVEASPTLPVPTSSPTPLGAVAPLGVMIDNDPHARPQTGLNSADVVYETVAEFNLTRFLAIFFADAPPLVGSIRSTRPYYALAMTEYGGGLVHCLDVPGTTPFLDQGNVFNFDLCRGAGDEAALRVTARVAPFNLYVNARLLQSELRAHPPRGAAALLSRAPLPASASDATTINILYPEGHRVVWTWNGQLYERAQDGAPHVAANGSVVTTDVIVVQRATTRPTRYFGEAGYHMVELIGSGDGLILAYGKSTPVHWSRAGVDGSTTYADTSGTTVPFPPGRVFIQIVPTDTQVDVGT